MNKKYAIIRRAIPYVLLTLLIIFCSIRLYDLKVLEKQEILKKVDEFDDYIENKMVVKEDSPEKGFSVAKSELVMLGVLYVPDIDLTMPIYKGIDDFTLNEGAGIIPGTGDINNSKEEGLPIITSHNGGHFKNLFMNLPKLKEGDSFYIKNLSNEIQEYKIVNSVNLHASEEEEYLAKLQKPKDKKQIILRTCVPIGINSHRLLLTGEFSKTVKTINELPESTQVISKQEIIYGVGIVIPLCLIIVFIIEDKKKSKKDLN